MWYAIQTFSHHEPKAEFWLSDRLARDRILYPTWRQKVRWHDRWKEIDRPLFPGYLFAAFDWSSERTAVLSQPGVCRIVGGAFDQQPVPELEIEQIRILMRSPELLEPSVGYRPTPGDLVEVRCGPLTGLRGTVTVAKDGKMYAGVYIPSLMSGARVKVNVEWLRKAA